MTHTEDWDHDFPEDPVLADEGGDQEDRPPLPEGYRYDTDGNIQFNTGSDEKEQWQFLCSHLSIEAATRDEHGENWGRLIRSLDREGNWHEWAMPNRMLSGNGDEYRKVLLDKGVDIASGSRARQALHDLLTRANPPRVRRCVDRLGWHEDVQGDVYVQPDQTIPPDRDIVFQSETGRAHAHGRAGALEDWKDNVAAPAENSSRLITGICTAFGATLLKIAGQENGGIHFRGSSSIGKTTALVVAGSVWGGGGLRGYVRSWRTTDNGLEGIALAHCDSLLCLDEMSQVSGDVLGAAAYMLANGQGKTRATRDGLSRPQPSWRLNFLSSGETSLQDKIRESPRQPRIAAGQEIRVADIAADAGKGFGIFESVPENMSPGDLAQALSEASKTYYGTAGPAFVEKLVQEIDHAKSVINEIVERFVRENADGTNGQVQRVARRFGLIAAAGELAIDWDILPYWPYQAYDAVQRCFEAWLASRGTTGPSEIERGIAQVRAFFAQHGVSRFEPLDSDEAQQRVTYNRAGFRQGNMCFVFPEIWRDEICNGFDAKMITAELVQRGMLDVGGDGKPQKAKRLPGWDTTIRVYHVNLDRLFDGV